MIFKENEKDIIAHSVIWTHDLVITSDAPYHLAMRAESMQNESKAILWALTQLEKNVRIHAHVTRPNP